MSDSATNDRSPKTDDLRPMTEVQMAQERAFIKSLEEECQTYWDMVEVGDELGLGRGAGRSRSGVGPGRTARRRSGHPRAAVEALGNRATRRGRLACAH